MQNEASGFNYGTASEEGQSAFRVKLDLQQEQISSALTEYRTLANNPGPNDAVRGLISAQDALEKAVAGDITIGQAFAVVKDVATRLKDVESAYSTLGSDKTLLVETWSKQ